MINWYTVDKKHTYIHKLHLVIKCKDVIWLVLITFFLVNILEKYYILILIIRLCPLK